MWDKSHEFILWILDSSQDKALYMKTDYYNEIKNFIADNYLPVMDKTIEDENLVRKTLGSFFEDVLKIIPSKWIEEGDVYNALDELGFKYFSSKNLDKKGRLKNIEFYYYAILKT